MSHLKINYYILKAQILSTSFTYPPVASMWVITPYNCFGTLILPDPVTDPPNGSCYFEPKFSITIPDA